MTGPEVHRGGSGSPLVLLHGAAMSRHAWDPVLAGLERHHEVIAPTLPGHRGGRPWDPARGPFTVDRLVDDVCDQLDAEGIGEAHVVGNSLGGWVALELLRRGRARSAVALSPAGAWRRGLDLRRLVWSFHLMRGLARPALVPLLAHRPWVRRAVLRRAMERGDRVPAAALPGLVEDIRRCEVLPELLARAAVHGPTRALTAPAGPVRIAWAEHDRLIPWSRYGAPMRAVVPAAEFVVLPGVGHAPMWDDPALVVETVLDVTLPLDRSGARP